MWKMSTASFGIFIDTCHIGVIVFFEWMPIPSNLLLYYVTQIVRFLYYLRHFTPILGGKIDWHSGVVWMVWIVSQIKYRLIRSSSKINPILHIICSKFLQEAQNSQNNQIKIRKIVLLTIWCTCYAQQLNVFNIKTDEKSKTHNFIY